MSCVPEPSQALFQPPQHNTILGVTLSILLMNVTNRGGYLITNDNLGLCDNSKTYTLILTENYFISTIDIILIMMGHQRTVSFFATYFYILTQYL